jgi:phosphohistidine phosphatase
MGVFLKESGLLPDEIFSSPAVRARSTILLAAKEMGFDDGRIVWNENFYFDGPDAYINAIRSASDQSGLVMTVGHNPMTEHVIELLADKPFHESVPTAAITCLELYADSWDNLEYGSCTLQWMMRPKDLK